MSEFRSRRKGAVYVQLPPYAAGLLANLIRQLVELLSDGESTASDDPLEAMVGMDGPRDAPDDPALLRLLPDAHREDPDASSEFRRLTERNLRDGKVRDAVVVLGKLDLDEAGTEDLEFEIDHDEVRSWLRCLTDLRLTLAERLGVTANDEAYWESIEEGDERLPVYEIYQWLSYLLESLLDAAQK
jgi:Domain of unknown function (DUF2017)